MRSSTSKTTAALICAALFAGSPTPALACDCLWQGAFVDSQQHADLIVAGRVISHSGNSMDLAVAQVLRGEEFQPEIRIWGDNGKLCRPSIYQFERDTQWVLALQRIDSVPADGFDPNTPNLSYGRERDYAISRCGVNWLQQRDGFVHGNVVEAGRWQYKDEQRAPVLFELLQGWLDGDVPLQALQLANAKDTRSRELLNETRVQLRHDEDRQSLAELLAEEGVELPAAGTADPAAESESGAAAH